jgi:hypothetical protein
MPSSASTSPLPKQQAEGGRMPEGMPLGELALRILNCGANGAAAWASARKGVLSGVPDVLAFQS